MKSLIIIATLLLIFLVVHNISTNPLPVPIPWSAPQLLCDSLGDNLNPSFAKDNYYFLDSYNILVWERDWGNRSQIYLKDFAQPDSELAVTPDVPGVNNRKPVASVIGAGILIVWQSDLNGNYDLFSTIFSNGQFSTIRQVTSDTSDDVKPSLIWNHLVWERDSSIYFSKYLAGDSSWTSAVTLDSGGCANPIIAMDGVAYQKRTGKQFAIFERYRSGNNWNPPQLKSTGGDNQNPQYSYGLPLNLIWQYRDSSGSDWNLMNIPEWSTTPILFMFSPEDETYPVAAEVPVISVTDNFAPLYFAFENSQTGDMEIYASDEFYNEFSVRNISQFPGDDRRPVFSEFSFTEAESLQARVWLAWERFDNGHWQIWGSYAESVLPGLSVEEKEKKIVAHHLYQNYPNPFNPGTVIGYQLAVSGVVDLTIYNLLGQPVKNLVKGKQPAGYYEVVWDGKDNAGRDVASGVYLYQIRVGRNIKSRKMLLLR